MTALSFDRFASRRPDDAPILQLVPMPGDANPYGQVFGGWIMGQIDVAGAIVAQRRARSRVTTAAVARMDFHFPAQVGDVVSVYAEPPRVGRSSMRVAVAMWAQRRLTEEDALICAAEMVFVAVDESGRPRPVDPAVSS